MPEADYWYCACCGAPSQIAFETCPECGAEPEWMTEDEFFGEEKAMIANSTKLHEAPTPQSAGPGLRSIREIVDDLSKPIAARHLKTRQQGGKNLTYLPWYYAAKYLDYYAPGWSKEIRSISQIGDSLVMVVRLIIPCAEGEVWREASALEPIRGSGYGDAAVNAESAALRRAAAQFGLARYLYEK